MGMFEAQLDTMVSWFDQWPECSQNVALMKILKMLSPTQARFISLALDNSLNHYAALSLQEQEANSPGFVNSLIMEKKDVAMAQLLQHLPLLRPGNDEAKSTYLVLVHMLLSFCMETGCLMDETKQLLAYVVIHPALKEDRGAFLPWVKSLGERIMNGNKPPMIFTPAISPACAMAPINQSSPNGMSQQNVFRCNSTPPNELGTSQDDVSTARGQNRRFSLSSDHSGGPPLSPQSSPASSGSGSEIHLDDLRLSGYDAPGMKDVPTWLKSLRLHKYARLFANLTYDQMLSLTDETFDQTVTMTVTQGARRKIVLSISKLRERFSILCRVEQEVTNRGNLMMAMEELKNILGTPLQLASEDGMEDPPAEDIPSQFTKVLGKVCTELIVCGRGADLDALTCFLSLLDNTLRHESFTGQQKRRIASWKKQVQQTLKHTRFDQPRYVPQAMFLQPTVLNRAPLPLAIRAPVAPVASVAPVTLQGPAPLQSRPYLRSSLTVSTQPGPSGASIHAKRPSLQDQPLPEMIPDRQRTQSAPPNPPSSSGLLACAIAHTTAPPSASAPSAAPDTDPDLNSRLESLCLSMTEHALSGGSEM